MSEIHDPSDIHSRRETGPDRESEDQRQASAFFWGEMEQYAERLLACLRTANQSGVRDEWSQLALAHKEWLRTLPETPRSLSQETAPHRDHVENAIRDVVAAKSMLESAATVLQRIRPSAEESAVHQLEAVDLALGPWESGSRVQTIWSLRSRAPSPALDGDDRSPYQLAQHLASKAVDRFFDTERWEEPTDRQRLAWWVIDALFEDGRLAITGRPFGARDEAIDSAQRLIAERRRADVKTGRVRGHLIVADQQDACDACGEIYRRGETIIECIDPDEYFHRVCGAHILLPGSFTMEEADDHAPE